MPERFEVGGVELAVHLWGPDDGVPVLFWHAVGAVASGLYATELAEPLTDAGFRLIAPDGPGFGGSPLLPEERYAMPALVELVGGLLDRLGVDRAAFVGHSWGGTIGVHAAAALPDRIAAVALLDAAYADPSQLPSRAELLAASRERLAQWRFPDEEAAREHLVENVLEYRASFFAVCRAALRDQDGELVPVTTPEARARALGGIVDWPATRTHPALAASGVPVLVLVAGQPPEAEQHADLERFTATVPQAEIRRMDDCGHDLIADAGPEVARILRTWLQGLSSLSH